MKRIRTLQRTLSPTGRVTVRLFAIAPRLNESNVPRLLIKDSDRTIVGRLRVLMRVADRSQACPSQLAQGTHHVKNNACLSGLIKMQIVPHDNVEQVVRGKSTIARRLDMIAGHEEFLLTIRSRKDARLRIVSSIGKKLQS